MSKVHRFEMILTGRDYWIEIREIPNSFTHYQCRNKHYPDVWEELIFYPGQDFKALVSMYSDPYSMYKEVPVPDDPSSISSPSFNERLITKPVDYKCKCDINSLMQQGCKCGGK